jgi:hypothetical protein
MQIFKDGQKATYDKAVKKGIPVVSVLWLDTYVASIAVLDMYRQNGENVQCAGSAQCHAGRDGLQRFT